MKWLLSIVSVVAGGMVVLGLIGWRMSKRNTVANPHATGSPGSGRPPPALILLTGPRAGERIALHSGFTIGKHITSDLVIEDGFTSGHHAHVTMDAAGNCTLHDRGSTNGTFVGGIRIQHVPLTHGAEIKIGSIELRFLER